MKRQNQLLKRKRTDMQMEISKTFTFEASHVLPKHPGKCSRLHGHSWKLTVAVKAHVAESTGFVMDYADLKGFVQPLVDDLDHTHLGTYVFQEYTGLDMSPGDIFSLERWRPKNPHYPEIIYPSSENLIVWIAQNLPIALGWSRLELDETCTSKCILMREDYEQARKRV